MPSGGRGPGAVDHAVSPGGAGTVGDFPGRGRAALGTLGKPRHGSKRRVDAESVAVGGITQVEDRCGQVQLDDHARRVVRADIGGDGVAGPIRARRDVKRRLSVVVKPAFGRDGRSEGLRRTILCDDPVEVAIEGLERHGTRLNRRADMRQGGGKVVGQGCGFGTAEALKAGKGSGWGHG